MATDPVKVTVSVLAVYVPPLLFQPRPTEIFFPFDDRVPCVIVMVEVTVMELCNVQLPFMPPLKITLLKA